MSPSTKLQQVAVAVVERGTEVLIGLRPSGAPLAGYWEFPGGKVKPSETFEDAVVRECFEETGVRITILGEYLSTTHQYEHATVHLRFFRCVTDERIEPKGSFRWVRAEDLDQYQFPEANAELLRRLTNCQSE